MESSLSFSSIAMLFLCWFLLAINGASEEQHEHLYASQESDRILRLPGQPAIPAISQYSGYITVNKQKGRALFYWFFEAQSDPDKKPLLLWLNGGPGCSSIGYGAAVELGPLRIKNNATGLEFNRFAWNKEANLLFLESPVGVGFSYTNTTSDLLELDDVFVAEDSYNFLVNWMKRFPRYRSHDLYLSGESYAGHYVPQLAKLVYDRNQKGKYPHMNIKGFIVGNPETEDYFDSKGLVEYAWSHSVISDQLFQKITNSCDFEAPRWSKECINSTQKLFQQYKLIDIYNVYAPKCFSANSSTASDVTDEFTYDAFSMKGDLLRRMRIPGGYDPCYSSYAEEYFNREEVKKSMHANVTGGVRGKWKVCNESMFQTYNITVASILPIYTELIKAGLRIWIYSGDADGRVPVIGSRYCVEALHLPLKSPWRPWFHNGQVGGRFVEYEGLTMATVRGAGHLVPLNKPSEALRLISTYLSGHQLPIQRTP